MNKIEDVIFEHRRNYTLTFSRQLQKYYYLVSERTYLYDVLTDDEIVFYYSQLFETESEAMSCKKRNVLVLTKKHP